MMLGMIGSGIGDEGSGVAVTGTGFVYVAGGVLNPAAQKADLADSAKVTGILPRARGGTGIDFGTLTGLALQVLRVNAGETAFELAAIPNVVAGGAAGFMTGADKTKLDTFVLARQYIAGAGLTGGGDLSADRTLNVGANVDGSIVVNADDVKVGVLATDAQHGVRGGGTLHANVVAGGAAGFISGADKAALDSLVSTSVATTRNVIAGAGLTGGGTLAADRTFNVIANADGSIVVNADDIQVGVLATDAQHGNRGGGGIHALVVAGGAAGFMSGADKTKLDGVPTYGAGITTWLTTPSSANLAAAVTDETGTGAVVFGTAPTISLPVVDAIKLGGGTPATVGVVRFPATTSTALLAIKDASAVDRTLLGSTSVNSSSFIIGDATNLNLDVAGNTLNLTGGIVVATYIAGTVVFSVGSTSVTTTKPIIGSSAAFGLHGRATQAMADANQTLASAIYSRREVKLTGAITANRTATWPLPSSEDRSYSVFVDNQCTGAFSVVLACSSGTTVTLANGVKQELSITPDGVKAKSAAL